MSHHARRRLRRETREICWRNPPLPIELSFTHNSIQRHPLFNSIQLTSQLDATTCPASRFPRFLNYTADGCVRFLNYTAEGCAKSAPSRNHARLHTSSRPHKRTPRHKSRSTMTSRENVTGSLTMSAPTGSDKRAPQNKPGSTMAPQNKPGSTISAPIF